MNDEQLEAGDVVQLQTGGTHMTIICKRRDGQAVKTAWFEGQTMQREWFMVPAIRLVKKAKQAPARKRSKRAPSQGRFVAQPGSMEVEPFVIKGSQYVAQAAAGEDLLRRYSDYALSIGVKVEGDSMIAENPEQATLLDAWWKENAK